MTYKGTTYGYHLYQPGDNIMFDWLKNIDGHHQWLELALPMPRKGVSGGGYQAATQDDNNSYGYAFGEKGKASGLRIWQDPKNRANVFEKIFIGPIAQGITDPAALALPALITGYPYPACTINPFPDTMKGQSHALRIATKGPFGGQPGDDRCYLPPASTLPPKAGRAPAGVSGARATKSPAAPQRGLPKQSADPSTLGDESAVWAQPFKLPGGLR
jgi:hypothetical protein